MYFSMQAFRQVWSFDEREEPGGVGMHFSKQFSLSFCFHFCLVSEVWRGGRRERRSRVVDG